MRVNATLDAEVERHYLDFLRTVEEYLRPKQDRVTVVELSKRISKPPEIDQDFPSFSHALRDDPMGRFEFSGSDDDLAVQLASSHSSTRKATTPLGPQSTISPPKEQGDNITAMDFDIEPIRSVTSSSFICPITQEEMHDPVIAADGFTYERKAIEQWFSKCKRSPSTNNDMRNTSLVPNRILKQIMEDSNQIDVDGVFGPTIRRSCSCPTPACQRWSSTARNSRYPSGGEEGLWVYEVVKDVALAYTSGDDIESVDAAANSVSPISGWVFVQGQLVSSTSRRCNAAGLDVVKLEHGLGWLCAAHLREIQIAPELRVFQVTCEHQLGKRAVPDHRRVFMRSSAGSAVRQGQVLSSSHAVTGKDGAIHLRIDGGWVPDRKFSKGQPVPLMVELDVKESLVVYKVGPLASRACSAVFAALTCVMRCHSCSLLCSGREQSGARAAGVAVPPVGQGGTDHDGRARHARRLARARARRAQRGVHPGRGQRRQRVALREQRQGGHHAAPLQAAPGARPRPGRAVVCTLGTHWCFYGGGVGGWLGAPRDTRT